MKLIRVTKGLYRTDAGHSIFQHPWRINCADVSAEVAKSLKWVVTFTDFFGVKRHYRFRTLADVRQELSKR